MANNISVKDAAAASQTLKTTDTAGVHTPHHNVDTLPDVDVNDISKGTQTNDVKITLDSEAVVLGAGSAAIGKLAANSGVDIGDVDVTSLPALPAGTNAIGSTKDNGPAQTVTRTYTSSADMTTAADITAAPTAGQKIVAMDIMVSADTAMSFSIQEETSATVFAKVFIPANGTVQITLRGYLKAAVADKKLQGKASVAGNVAITAVYFSEA